MSKDVIGADELQPPVQSIQDVDFHVHELVICKWRLDVVQELCNTGVSLLMVLG